MSSNRDALIVDSWLMDSSKTLGGRLRLKGVCVQIGNSGAASTPGNSSDTDNLLVHFHNGTSGSDAELFTYCMPTGLNGFQSTYALPISSGFDGDYILFDGGLHIPALIAAGGNARNPDPAKTQLTIFYEGS